MSTFQQVGLHLDPDWLLDRLVASARELTGATHAEIYRTVQESLTNAAKHAGARSVDVVVVERGGEVEIAVRDDGAGFDVEAPTGGFGLTGMRERISLAGGRVEIISSKRGTAVLASIPSARARVA